LVKAAETELFLVHKERKWARFEEAFPKESDQWARFDEVNNTIDSTKTSTTTTSTTTATRSEVDYERDESLEERGGAPSDEWPSEEEEEDDQKEEEEDEAEELKQRQDTSESNRGFLGRYNIQWIDLSSPPAPKKKAVKKKSDKTSTKPKKKVSGGRKCSHNRRVVFHRYDELIDDDGKKDYIFSLHEREVEYEMANYDVIDKVEETVSDVGYFFSLLKTDLQAEAFHRIGRLRRKEGKKKRKEEEEYDDDDDDDEDEDEEEEEEEKKTPSRPNRPHVKYDTGHARPQVAV